MWTLCGYIGFKYVWPLSVVFIPKWDSPAGYYFFIGESLAVEIVSRLGIGTCVHYTS